MTGFNHGMTGVVIALVVKRPEMAIPLSFISHYLADFIPHFGFVQEEVLEKKFIRSLRLDFLFSVVLMLILAILFPSQIVLIWACMIAAAMPDLIWWFYRRTVKNWPAGLGWFTSWHFRINNKAHLRHFYYDIAWLALMWAIVLIIRL